MPCQDPTRPGFEYDWCQESLNWQDLLKKSTRTLTCRAHDASEAPFRFQSFAIYDRQDPNSRTYPRLTLRLRAPVEVENLLPYDIQYRIFDKNLNHNWSSYLRKGGISPSTSSSSRTCCCSALTFRSSCFSPSEFAIIATDNPDDFPVEKVMTLADAENLKLNLRLHYSKHPDSGGAFKVQIYSPYIFINQSGLPFALKTKSWLGSAKLVAGQDQTGVSAEIRKTPEPFLFSHNSNDRRNRVLMRVGDSQWSKPLSFEAIGSETEVVIPSASRNEEIHVGLTVEDGLGKFKLSKVVKLTPRYWCATSSTSRSTCGKRVPPTLSLSNQVSGAFALLACGCNAADDARIPRHQQPVECTFQHRGYRQRSLASGESRPASASYQGRGAAGRSDDLHLSQPGDGPLAIHAA